MGSVAHCPLLVGPCERERRLRYIHMLITLLPLLRRFWPFLAVAGLLICAWLYIRHVDHSARAEQKAADTAAIEKVQLEARAADLAHAREVETAQANATKEANDAYAPRLAQYSASLAAYSARLRDKADQGGRLGAHLPSTADAANIIDRADQLSVLDDDLKRCTEAVTRLENARDWWASVEKAPR